MKNARCVICREFIKRLDDGKDHKCAACDDDANMCKREQINKRGWI